jgi:hypothetical protein
MIATLASKNNKNKIKIILEKKKRQKEGLGSGPLARYYTF